MKFIRLKFLLFTLVVIKTSAIHAQPAYNEIKPSVNTQQFFSVVSATNCLHTGQLAVNIPLFNLQGRGINIPISINFNAEGITHYSDASNIGLGWSLLAGGVITRTIRGAADQESGNYSNRAWHYDGDFLFNKLKETTIDNDVFGNALARVVADPEPDLFSYSFLGYTGDISIKFNNDGSIIRKLLPDESFRMEKIAAGYKITANDGTEYIFEYNETISDNVMSWFLTEIKTLQGGNVKFQYSEDARKKWGPEGPYYITSQRVTRIDFDFGYLLFPSSTRGDLSIFDDPSNQSNSRCITGIELYNRNGSLIKGYEFAQSYFVASSTQKWLKLDGIREFDCNRIPLPPYNFEYDYKLSERGYWSFPGSPENSWAHNPSGLASMDRDFSGHLSPWMSCEMKDGICIPYAEGYDFFFDNVDGTSINDYLCLTKIKFPAGGSEKYYYEPHDYKYLSTSRDFIQPDNLIQGKRLYKKEIIDEENISQTVLYSYCLHDDNHNPIYTGDAYGKLNTITSGVLVNPTIHISTMYKPIYNQNTYVDPGITTSPDGTSGTSSVFSPITGSNPGMPTSPDGTSSTSILPVEDNVRQRLKASLYSTIQPQNDRSLAPVFYSEVEEVSVGRGGRKIYYFERVAATPPETYFYQYKTSALVPLKNTLYGKQEYPNDKDFSAMSDQNHTYLAYPLGRFYVDLSLKGKVKNEVWLNFNGAIVKKVENEYTPGWMDLQYGVIAKELRDDRNNPYYLISRPMTTIGSRQLTGRTITSYFDGNAVVEKQTFVFNNLNLPSSSFSTLSKNDILEITYKYANDRPTDISTSTTVLENMISKNMIGIPLKTEKKVNLFTKESIITNYGADLNPSDIKELAGSVYEDKVIFDVYDSKGNILQYHKKSDNFVSYIWGYNQAYPVVKVEGKAYSCILPAIKDAITSHVFSGKTDYASINDDIGWLKNQLSSLITDNTCMVSFYTYAPFIGKTSQTDPNGITTYYEYDSYGRLQAVRDSNGNILNTYEYEYKYKNEWDYKYQQWKW